MLEKVKKFVERYQLIVSGDHLLVACSGGSDSVALLYLLAELSTHQSFTLAVAHVHHGLRALEADRDEDYVRQLSSRLGLPFFSQHYDVQSFADEQGLATEEAGRIIRYRFFRQLAVQHGYTKIVTAHHQDDQAETVLMNLLRGSGSMGLRGILPQNGEVIRPLLTVTKQEIINYLATIKVTACYDETNGDIKILRNRIRKCLLPQLELEYNNHIKASLCRTAAILQDEQDFIRQSAQVLFTKLITTVKQSLFLSLDLRTSHPALIRAVIRLIIEKKQGDLKGISFHHVEELIKMMFFLPVGSCFPLPKGLLVYKNQSNMEFTCEKRQVTLGIKSPIELNIPGETVVSELNRVIVSRVGTQMPTAFSDETAWFDYERLTLPIFVRCRHNGDQIQPYGFNGTKKLKKIFNEHKLSQQQRSLVPIIYNNQGILWVGTLRQSSVAAVTVHTRKFLQLFIEMQED